MLRRFHFASKIVTRNFGVTRINSGLIDNLKKALEEEAAKEKLGDEVKKATVDLEKIAREQKESFSKYAESEKFKAIKKETESTSEKIAKQADDLSKKVGLDTDKVLDAAGKMFENVKNYEFTQVPEDRMAIFDDYQALNYQPPPVRKRKQIDDKHKNVVFDADTESDGVAVHRDYQIYEKLKNSAMGKKFDDISTRVNASESNFVRGGIFLTDKIKTKLAKVTTNDHNECMKAIRQIEPNFTQDNFVRFLKDEMIPIILEATAFNDKEVVEDWAFDAAAQKFLLSHNVAKKDKAKFYEKTLSLERVELLDALKQDDGTPAIKIRFETNKSMAFTDKDKNIINGEGYPQPDEVYKCYHDWVVVRDMMEPEPTAAWRVLECDAFAQKQAF